MIKFVVRVFFTYV